MSKQPSYLPGYDQFNLEISDDRFPEKGMVPRAVQAIVTAEAWTDAWNAWAGAGMARSARSASSARSRTCRAGCQAAARREDR